MSMTPTDFAAILGAITGSVSLGFLIYTKLTDKPKLLFEKENQAFYPAEGNNNFTTILVNMKVHNKGTKSTTVHHTTLTFNYNGKQWKVEDNHSSLVVSPNSTMGFSPSLNLHKDNLLIHGKIDNCILTISHTFDDNIVFNLGIIEEYKK